MTESDAKVGLKMMMTTVAFILVGVVVVFSVKRFNYASPKDIHWLRNIPIAHRGLHDEKHDENSLGSFDNAVSNGYAIELDVRLTKDRVPVVIHDNNLKRIFGLNQSVSKMSVADLKEHRLPKSGEKVPTLSEALEHINGRAPVLIEIKNFGLPGKLEPRVLEVLEGYKGKYAIQSFNPLVLRWFKQHDQELPLGLLLADVPFLRFSWFRNFKDNVFSAMCSPSFIAYDYYALNAEIAEEYRKNDVILLGWNMLHEVLAHSSERKYVDNIIFDIGVEKITSH